MTEKVLGPRLRPNGALDNSQGRKPLESGKTADLFRPNGAALVGVAPLGRKTNSGAD